eukprot:6387369-Amphidinium_carterae.1
MLAEGGEPFKLVPALEGQVTHCEQFGARPPCRAQEIIPWMWSWPWGSQSQECLAALQGTKRAHSKLHRDWDLNACCKGRLLHGTICYDACQPVSKPKSELRSTGNKSDPLALTTHGTLCEEHTSSTQMFCRHSPPTDA